LKSPARSDPFFTFDEFTAFAFSCVDPTLFLGNLSAAYAPPPSATNKANVATTFV
jgi:hypothetical protein